MYGFCHGFLDRPGLCLVKRNPFLPSVPRHNCQQFEVKLDEWQKRYIYCLSHTRTHTLSHCLHSSPFDLCFSLLSKLSFPATITPLFFFFTLSVSSSPFIFSHTFPTHPLTLTPSLPLVLVQCSGSTTTLETQQQWQTRSLSFFLFHSFNPSLYLSQSPRCLFLFCLWLILSL